MGKKKVIAIEKNDINSEDIVFKPDNNKNDNVAIRITTFQCSPIKTLLEAINTMLTNVRFYFDKDKILIREVNKDENLVINLQLDADKFEEYIYNLDEPVMIGIKLNYFYKIIKTVTNKNSLTISVDKDKQKDNISIIVNDNENNIHDTYEMTQINLNNKLRSFIDLDKYSCIINIPSNYFQKLCRDSSNMTDIVEITRTVDKKLIFKFSKDNITRTTIIEENVNFMYFLKNENENEIIYGKYSVKDLVSFSKCIGNSDKVRLYISNTLEVLIIESDIGNLGLMQVALRKKYISDES